jgi:hypothetical protein
VGITRHGKFCLEAVVFVPWSPEKEFLNVIGEPRKDINNLPLWDAVTVGRYPRIMHGGAMEGKGPALSIQFMEGC